MAVVHNTISIYSNDGTAVLGSVAVAESSITVQETGFSDALGSYEYGGDKKFLGFATSANATEPTYAIGDTFTVSNDTTLYIVESNADSITDLTNTTWYIHDDCSPYTGGTIYVPFEVGYLSGGGSYYYVDVYAVGTHINDRNYVINFSSYSGSSPDNENGLVSEYDKLNLYYTDTIFGGSPIVFKFGNDLGSANLTPLITWLESNGTQLKVTDLTNTTWYVPAGWEATAGYGIFSISFSFTRSYDGATQDYTGDGDYLGIGYFNENSSANYITPDVTSYLFDGEVYNNINSFIFSFTDGTDTTNPKLIAWLSKYGTLFKVSDLTNTTWYIDTGWQASAGYGQFNNLHGIIHSVSGEEPLYTDLTFMYIGYGFSDWEAVAQTNSIWLNSYPVIPTSLDSFIITIDGGNDVTNPLLILWLETYGIQLKVTNLTDTSWTVNAGWEAEAKYGNFNISGSGLYIDGELLRPLTFNVIAIGYSQYSSISNTITFAPHALLEDGSYYANNYSFELNFTGGTDVDNPKLLAWLSKYGELQEAEEPEQPTSTKKFTRLYLGEIVKTVGNKMFRKLQTTEYIPLPTLTSPTVEISENTLNIYDEEGLATSYDILVDGEVKATVEKVSTVSITLSSADGGDNNQVAVYVKFGTAPTENNDRDYVSRDGYESLYDAQMTTDLGNNLSIDVSPTAYIWQTANDSMAGYKLNGGSLINVGVGYANATVVALSDGDILTLVSTNLD